MHKITFFEIRSDLLARLSANFAVAANVKSLDVDDTIIGFDIFVVMISSTVSLSGLSISTVNGGAAAAGAVGDTDCPIR